MKIYQSLLDIILPPRCVISGEIVDSHGTISPKSWAALSFISAPYCDACGIPFEFDTSFDGSASQCAACLKEHPIFEKARAALVYDDASRDFILSFKHGDKTLASISMSPWLKMAGADFWEDSDVIVPVPLSRWRLWRRRYNQAALMAQVTGKSVNKNVIVDALLRTRATPSQGHLKANQRAENVKNAFCIHPKRAEVLRNKSIVLIDDVYTTGSTVKECAKALLKGGVKRVYVLSLARVVRPERF